MSNNVFDAWYHGMIGFHINSERILEDLEREVDVGAIQPERLKRWMKVCWNSALEAAQNTLVHDNYFYDEGPTWDGDDYYSCDPKKDIEDLKAP